MNLYSRGAHAVGREQLPWACTSRGARRGGHERLGGVDGGRKRHMGRERGGANGRGARTAVGRVGRVGRGAQTAEGAHSRGATTATGYIRAHPLLEARMGRVWPRATWFVGARTYAPSNGGAHVSSEEGINGVTLLISRCQLFSSLLLP
jgi:hypothetical protein